ncbi:MAG TPA: UDP-glucose 4-epimerase GalE [Spirochaetota bacterium]|nr:UDP-glucose 4-epimerase GalE [Spirochaetota bacterium]HPI90178.1 UDP-glucose 4-epimerase GalE [Spirochaetota bacterium]HPR49617.1 UDP-glucose 4-epimerase GalE [Spirochaetota bacterium]
MERVLVTGGAGYIGSHVVKLLGREGYDIAVIDDLSSGHREALLGVRLYEGNMGDKTFTGSVIKEFRPDAVMHFAAFIQVGESVQKPVKYYQNNTANTLNFLEVLLNNNVGKFIFSSTAAVFGMPEKVPVTEETPLAPINPYGMSKRFVEGILADISHAENFNYVALRYFNAAGADPEGELGQKYEASTHLITRALKTAKGEFPHLELFGTDYDTPDGTCIRDYIHVNDLASAHIIALKYLLDNGGSDVFNLGYGRGFSVREVIDITKKVTGIDFTVRESGRREGDPPVIIADSSKVKKKLNWSPQYDDLELIIRTAWEWEKKL